MVELMHRLEYLREHTKIDQKQKFIYKSHNYIKELQKRQTFKA